MNFYNFLFIRMCFFVFLLPSFNVRAHTSIEPNFALRPAHLEGVPVERDGSLNRNFRRELILGDNENSLHNADHENESPLQIVRQIELMFQRADTNKDGRLTREEMQKQIERNMEHHLKDARKESESTFQVVDEDGNGKIAWSEYKSYLKKFFNRTEGVHPRDVALKQKLNAEKEAFELADAEQDGLDEIEWLGFRHPEYSEVMLEEMVQELLNKLDKNHDKKLSASEFVDEFSTDENNNNNNNNKANAEADFRAERLLDFSTLVDRNDDGEADADELRAYINPRNPQSIVDEVKDLFTLADRDGDDKLTLEELKSRPDLFGASSFIHANIRLHEDL